MQFTKEDKKLLETVRTRHNIWRQRRWLFLGFWLLGAVLSFFYQFRQLRLASEGDTAAINFMVAWSGFNWGLCWFCAINAAFILGRWNNSGRELLLRLAKEHEMHGS